MLVFAMAVCVSAMGEVHKVPADFKTIQTALDSAKPGDAIAIAPGTYPEQFTLGDGLALFGSAQDACIIQGDGAGPVVTIAGAARLEGLTIRDGETGIYMQAETSLDIARCRIADNVEDGIGIDDSFNTVLRMNDCVVTGNGDGVDLESTQAVIRHCMFEKNRDDGLDLDGNAGALVYDCVFKDNPDDGIETRLATYTQAIILHCRFEGNGEDGLEFIDSPLADGLYNVVCVQNNVFRDNARHAVGFVDQKTEEADEDMAQAAVYACGNDFQSGGKVSANYAAIFDAFPAADDELGSTRASLVQGERTWSEDISLRMPTLVGIYNLRPTPDGTFASDLEGVTVSKDAVYLADDNNYQIYQLDRLTGKVVGSIPTKPFPNFDDTASGPEGLDIDGPDTLLLADDYGYSIHEISLNEATFGHRLIRRSTEAIGEVEGVEKVGERLLLATNRNEIHEVNAETMERTAPPVQITVEGLGGHVAGVGFDDATGRVFVTDSAYTGGDQKWRNNQSAFLALDSELKTVTGIWRLGPFSNDPRGIALADGLIYVADGRSDCTDARTGENYRGGIKVFVFLEDGGPGRIDQVLPLLPVRRID